jgi:hypothetical protein
MGRGQRARVRGVPGLELDGGVLDAEAVVQLAFIGVGEEAALRDAEGIEHHVGEETLAAFERLMRVGRK